MKSLLLLITLGLGGTLCMQAGPVYAFSISGPNGFNATGEITTSGSSSPYTIAGITGTLTSYTETSAGGATSVGGAITGLSTFDSATNFIPPASTGFSFSDANGDNYNVHGFAGTYIVSDSLGNFDEAAGVTFSLVALPETTTMAMSGLGLLAGALLLRRRQTTKA